MSVTFALLTRTLGRAVRPLASFAGVFCVIFYGFAQAHCMIFHDRLREFRTLTASSFTLLRSLLGDFDFMQLKTTEEFLGPIFFVLFVSIATLVILNMVIAIISDAYSEVDNDMKLVAREVEAQGLNADYRFHNLMAEVNTIILGLPPVRLVRFVFQLDRAAEVAQQMAYASQNSQKPLDDVEAAQHGPTTSKVVPFDEAASAPASPAGAAGGAPASAPPAVDTAAPRASVRASLGGSFRSPKKKFAKYARQTMAARGVAASPAHGPRGFVDPPPPAAQLQILRVCGSLTAHLEAADPALAADFVRLSEAEVETLAADVADSLRRLKPKPPADAPRRASTGGTA